MARGDAPKTMTFRGKEYKFYVNFLKKSDAMRVVKRLRKAGTATQYLPVAKNQHAVYTREMR